MPGVYAPDGVGGLVQVANLTEPGGLGGPNATMGNLFDLTQGGPEIPVDAGPFDLMVSYGGNATQFIVSVTARQGGPWIGSYTQPGTLTPTDLEGNYASQGQLLGSIYIDLYYAPGFTAYLWAEDFGELWRIDMAPLSHSGDLPFQITAQQLKKTN